MPNKISRKVKQKKKRVRRQKPTSQQSGPARPPATNPQLPEQNTLRQQLLARAAIPGFMGFNPQQYGNINNQRRIDQIKQDNQSIAQEINDYKVTIDALKKEKDGYKKDLKKKQSDYDKQKAELDTTKDKLAEATRIETESKRLKAQQQNLNQQLAEINSENTIITCKTKNDKLEADLNEQKLRNIELKRTMQQNELYMRGKKLFDEYQTILNENNGLADAMKDPGFINPNETMKTTYKNLAKEKAKKMLLEEQRKKQEEYQLLKLQQDSMPTREELAEYTKAMAEQIKTIEADIHAEKDKMYPLQREVGEYNADIAKRDELDKTLYNLKAEHAALQGKSAKLTAKVRAPINNYNKLKMGLVAQQEINNDTIKARIDLSNRHNQLRDENYLLEEKKKRLLAVDLPTEDIDNLAELEARNELDKEGLDAVTKSRKSAMQLQETTGEIEYQQSKDYQDYIKQIATTEIQAENNMKQAEAASLLAKAKEQRQKAELANMIRQQQLSQDLPLIQQVAAAEKELDSKYIELGKKASVISKILDLKRQYPDVWSQYISNNPGADLISLDSSQNRPLEELNGILNGFVNYLKSNPPESITDTSAQPTENTNNDN